MMTSSMWQLPRVQPCRQHLRQRFCRAAPLAQDRFMLHGDFYQAPSYCVIHFDSSEAHITEFVINTAKGCTHHKCKCWQATLIFFDGKHIIKMCLLWKTIY